MLRFNLRSEVKVYRPYPNSALGKVVLSRHDLMRRRLMAESLNRLISFMRHSLPQANDSLGRLEFKILSEAGRERLQAAQALRPEDMRMEIMQVNDPQGIVRHSLEMLNLICSDDHVEGKCLEFTLEDLKSGLPGVPDVPQCIFRMRLRTAKELGGHLKSFYPFLLKELAELVEKGRPYNQEEILSLLIKEHPGVTRVLVDYMLRWKGDFFRVLRPRCFEHDQRYVWFKPDQRYTGLARVITGEPGDQAVAIETEVGQIVKEGKLVPVISRQAGGLVYFNPSALALYEERGEVLAVDDVRGKRYILAEKSGSLLAEELVPSRRSRISASRSFLEFMAEKKLSSEARRAYPWLGTALEIACSEPQGLEPMLEAARRAAEHGASELGLAALLLFKSPNQPELDQLFIGRLAGGEFSTDKCRLMARRVASRITLLKTALAMKFKTTKGKEVADLKTFMQQMLNTLRSADENINREIRLLFFSLIAGRLRGLPLNSQLDDIHNLRMVYPALAERCGFRDLADEIRNGLFFLLFKEEHQRVKGQVEAALGMTYLELQMHLHNTKELIESALLAVGIDRGDFTINFRVKSPYSLWEKMDSQGIEEVSELYDILGISIVARDDRLAYEIVALLEQLMPRLSHRKFSARYGDKPVYSDMIRQPRRSGFSAITMYRQAEFNLTVEVQVTSRERDRNNREGAAAHWKHKLKREIEDFYDIEVEHLFDLED